MFVPTMVTSTFATAAVSMIGVGMTSYNPISQLSLNAGGITVEVDKDGLETAPAESRGFEIKITLKSGLPIKVRL